MIRTCLRCRSLLNRLIIVVLSRVGSTLMTVVRIFDLFSSVGYGPFALFFLLPFVCFIICFFGFLGCFTFLSHFVHSAGYTSILFGTSMTIYSFLFSSFVQILAFTFNASLSISAHSCTIFLFSFWIMISLRPHTIYTLLYFFFDRFYEAGIVIYMI